MDLIKKASDTEKMDAEDNAAGPSSSTGTIQLKIKTLEFDKPRATSTVKRRLIEDEDETTVAGLEPHLKKLRLFGEKKPERPPLRPMPSMGPFKIPNPFDINSPAHSRRLLKRSDSYKLAMLNDVMPKSDTLSSPELLKLAGPSPLKNPAPLCRKRSYHIALLGKDIWQRTSSFIRREGESKSFDVTKEAPKTPRKLKSCLVHKQLAAEVFAERKEALRLESQRLRTCSAIETDV